LKNTAAPVNTATRDSVAFQYQPGVGIGKNIVADRTAAPASAYAPDLRIFMCASSSRDQDDHRRKHPPTATIADEISRTVRLHSGVVNRFQGLAGFFQWYLRFATES
jgi:hypothetical protein